jgi:hypothetical protein
MGRWLDKLKERRTDPGPGDGGSAPPGGSTDPDSSHSSTEESQGQFDWSQIGSAPSGLDDWAASLARRLLDTEDSLTPPTEPTELATITEAESYDEKPTRQTTDTVPDETDKPLTTAEAEGGAA